MAQNGLTELLCRAHAVKLSPTVWDSGVRDADTLSACNADELKEMGFNVGQRAALRRGRVQRR